MSEILTYGMQFVVPVEISKVWDVVGDFSEVSFFGVNKSTLKMEGDGEEGTVRSHVDPWGNPTKEMVVSRSDKFHCLTYSCPKTNAPFNETYISTVKLDEVGGKKTQVRWWCQMCVNDKEKEDAEKAMKSVPGFFKSSFEKWFDCKIIE